MTWLSYFTKSGNLLFVLPLILKKFSAPEIAVWTFFMAILSMSALADFGFRNTFIRLFALAYGGARDIGIFSADKVDTQKSGDTKTNWELIEKLYSATTNIYRYVSLVLAIILFSAGSFSLITPISHVANQPQSWIAWAVIGISIICDFYGKVFSNYLEGLYMIALVKRIEFFFKLGSILTSFLVLILAPSLLNLVIVNATWTIINVLRNYYLCTYVCEGRFKSFKAQPLERKFFLKIWKPAWRGGVSGLMSQGLTNLTGIIYGQVGNPAAVASYMIALRVITEIRNVSNAPFYSKIPLMVKMRAEGNYKRLVQIAQRGMVIAHLVYTVSAVAVGLFLNMFLKMIGSNVHFVDPKLWLMLSFAFYVHRYGALHMQLYLTTNHVISHIADTIAGVIFIITSLLLTHSLGLYAVPIGMLAGYLGFYAWFAAYHSLKSINSSFFKFEYKVSSIPAVIFLIYTIIALI